MKYTATRLKKMFVINEIVTIHYFEYMKDYKYTGESHDFWEFTYVDKGEIDIELGDKHYRLEQGNIAFHQPNEYHNLSATGDIAPNLIVVSFKCNSPAMNFFKNRILPLSDIEKGDLATIIKEAMNCFSSPLEDTYLTKLSRNKTPMPDSEQLISLSLEHLLISLYRNFGGMAKNTSTLRQGIQHDIVKSILNYMQEHICEKLYISQIAQAVNMSKSSVSTIFKEKMNDGVISYFIKMKIDTSKVLIREGKYNISQISFYLGFDSIHTFSRTFKKITGMTPTEYGKSVKINFEDISKH